MKGPYRTPALVDVDPTPPRALPPAFAKAFSAAATVLLLVASASLGATTWTVIRTQARAAEEGPIQVRSPAAPRAPGSSTAAPAMLAALGPETHDADVLWSRAERLAAAGFDFEVVRARMPDGELGRERVRVVPEEGGLRVVELDARSAAAQAGLRVGDRITGIDGYALRRPEDVLRVYSEAKEAKAVVVELVRGGKPMVVRIDRDHLSR